MSQPQSYSNNITHSSDLDDDVDQSYHTATEEEEEVDGDEDEDEEDDDDREADIEYHLSMPVDDDDGEGDQDGEDEEDNDEENDAGIDVPTATRRLQDIIGSRVLTRAQVLALLANSNISHILSNTIFRSNDDDDDDTGVLGFMRRRRQPRDPDRFPKVPSEEGTKLMNSGVFGSTELSISPNLPQQKDLARRILDRELGIGDTPLSRKLNRDMMLQSLIPTMEADMLIRYESPVYSGQFSDDGNFFFSVGKDFKVRMYDTSSPYNWRYYKTAACPFGQWTLSDASLSPDNRWLAYTSLLPHVCLAPTDPNDKGDPYILDLSGSGQTGRSVRDPFHASRYFAIFSVRYSGDGREIVAGTSHASIIVYDIESRTVLHNVTGHEDDVNAVCFADKSSPHILYSGSDDTTIKVWDRRSMGDGREAGCFVGHIEGLTYIDSKGDGRYILSNGKDQSMKLWDLRMVMGPQEFERRNPTHHTRNRTLDYRWESLEEEDWFQHPDDNSVVTFRGHSVTRTLIRCHFSPPGSTNSRYVYSGSSDGKVYVWNLDATVAATIDVSGASEKLLTGTGASMRRPQWRRSGNAIVREAYWHPNAPLIVASSWGGPGMNAGICTVHSYNEAEDDEDDPQMGRVVNEKLVPIPAEEAQRYGMDDDDW